MATPEKTLIRPLSQKELIKGYGIGRKCFKRWLADENIDLGRHRILLPALVARIIQAFGYPPFL